MNQQFALRRNFNPRPPCGGRLQKQFVNNLIAAISIHAPRAGGDYPACCRGSSWPNHFNPRPPCGGRQRLVYLISLYHLNFNPRPPCGGRLAWPHLRLYSFHFNPRPPCGGRQRGLEYRERKIRFQSTPPVRGATGIMSCGVWVTGISIHAPRAGGDPAAFFIMSAHGAISIHAPRAGGDGACAAARLRLMHFNPRPPCGGRLLFRTVQRGIIQFQSTPPVRGATFPVRYMFLQYSRFQSTPPVRGATTATAPTGQARRYFNPRPPCGGRRIKYNNNDGRKNFNPRPPCGGRRGRPVTSPATKNFNPRPPCGGRPEI